MHVSPTRTNAGLVCAPASVCVCVSVCTHVSVWTCSGVAGLSHLRETEVQDVGVQFVQRSGETVPAQVLSTELTVEETGWSDR